MLDSIRTGMVLRKQLALRKILGPCGDFDILLGSMARQRRSGWLETPWFAHIR